MKAEFEYSREIAEDGKYRSHIFAIQDLCGRVVSLLNKELTSLVQRQESPVSREDFPQIFRLTHRSKRVSISVTHEDRDTTLLWEAKAIQRLLEVIALREGMTLAFSYEIPALSAEVPAS